MKNEDTDNQIIDVTGSFGTLYHPKSALVFYKTKDKNEDMYVEYFDMDAYGNPINAHPLTVRESQRLAKMLNIQNKKDKDFLKPKGVISNNILYIDSSENGKVVWFTGAQERELFFVENLTIPNGKANIPPLIWIANRQGLRICALKNDNRPDDNTPLFYAPFFNVYENGNVCMGTVDVKIKNSASLEEFTENWEHYFFNSYFSHLMNQHNPIKGNCVNLWKDLMETNEDFPTDVLINAQVTLKKIIL